MRVSLCMIGFLVCYCFSTAGAVAVMSVDLGTEWMKIAIVSPGVPMEIVLNKESKRKTPVALSFRDGDREFGENAASMSTRFPDKTYRFILDLVGKEVDNPIVQRYIKRFPFYDIVGDSARKTVVFRHDKQFQFTPEELLAMILENAKNLAQQFSQQPIRDAVITVPAFFNQAERRAIIYAAELAGLKVLQLMSTNAAVALNYGIFRRKDFNETPQNIMFYDMGADSTTATVVGYQVVKTKEKGYVESHPQLTILGIGFDRTLGGLEMTLWLRDYMASKFAEQIKLTKADIFGNQRAMAKLLKEAERVKMILSANADHIAQVENLLDDNDFKLHVSRAEFEKLCEDLFLRAGQPIEAALKSAAMTSEDIDQVVLVGAGTRVPKVQEQVLLTSKKSELSKNLNTDEAAALGAVYQAAHLGQGFKVKRFIVKEAVVLPIQVSFERQLDSNGGLDVKTVTRTLFSRLNPFPQKKVMTFNRLGRDFDLHLSYGESGVSPEEHSHIGRTNFSKVSLVGVADAFSKHQDAMDKSKGIKAHFRMDESGILNIDQVECVFETVKSVQPDDDEESTLSKLGSTISKLFAGTVQSDDEGGADTKTTEPEKEKDDAANDKLNDEAELPTANDSSAADNATSKMAEVVRNETTNSTKTTTTELVKEKLTMVEVKLDIPELSSESMAASRKKLQEFNDREREKHSREVAHNALESFILETQDKLNQPEYEMVTTEAQREKMRALLSETSEWLDEEGFGATAKLFKEKLAGVKSSTKDMFDRFRENRERPEAVAALKEMLNISSFFLRQAKNVSEDEQYFTAVELETLEKLLADTQEWLSEKEEKQAKMELSKSPVVTVRSLTEKIAALDREVKYLVNKARTVKPRPVAKKNETGNMAEDAAGADNSTVTEDDKTPQSESSPPPLSEGTDSQDTNAKETRQDTTNTSEDEMHLEL